jgi:3-demethylubiquinone-9 3-methyltransferase
MPNITIRAPGSSRVSITNPGISRVCRAPISRMTDQTSSLNGMMLREPIVAVDEKARRLVWSAEGGPFTHYNASLQVFAESGQCPAWPVPNIGLNGGPAFKHNEAFSFQIATDDQQETDRYWNAIVGNGGQESQCGWCKDKWGVSWQITPRVLTEALAAGGDEAKRAFDVMMGMKKIDIAAIEAARRG